MYVCHGWSRMICNNKKLLYCNEKKWVDSQTYKKWDIKWKSDRLFLPYLLKCSKREMWVLWDFLHSWSSYVSDIELILNNFLINLLYTSVVVPWSWKALRTIWAALIIMSNWMEERRIFSLNEDYFQMCTENFFSIISI